MKSIENEISDMIAGLNVRIPLSYAEIETAAGYLLQEESDMALKADFLRALSQKGETDAELAGFAEAFLARAVDPGLDPAQLPGPMIDCCGTGGDKLDLFNVSTTSMFILAAGGAVVVKHGNRNITSQCGGADVLEALGVRIDLLPADYRRCVEKVGCGFLFAPLYHPAFKVIAPVRKALAEEGCPTLFNFLGPLLNPARPAHQLVGLFSESALPKYADVLLRLGRTHAWAAHGRCNNLDGTGMDEISTLGTTHVHRVFDGKTDTLAITPKTLDALQIAPATLEDLRGGNREQNARITLGILDGTLRGPKRDLVTLNAAAGFVVTNLAADLEHGFALANEQLDSGRALAKLRALQEFR